MRLLAIVVVVGITQTCLPALSAQAASPAPPMSAYRHRILGVFDTGSGDAVEGVRVTDMINHVTALTTRTGTVSLVFLPDGPNLVRIEKIGYQALTIGVQISPDDTVPLTVLLSPLVTTLPTVVTRDSSPSYLSPGLRAFEERRKLGLGHFVPEVELRKHDTEKMTNLVRRFSSLTMICPRTGPRRGECYAISMRQSSSHVLQGGGCPLDVWIDGVAVTDNNLNGMSISDYAGVEYYAGGATLPPQYNKTGSSCGVLLFWTRER